MENELPTDDFDFEKFKTKAIELTNQAKVKADELERNLREDYEREKNRKWWNLGIGY